MKIDTLVTLGVTWMKFQRAKESMYPIKVKIPQFLDRRVLLRPVGMWQPEV